MSTEPERIRSQVADLLADLPDLSTADVGADIDIDEMAQRLEQAHDVLVRALESVEKD